MRFLDFSFKEFINGSFDFNPETGTHASLFLRSEKVDAGGAISKEEIDRLADYPDAQVVTISGLRQDTFEYFVKTYGAQLRAVRFFKNRFVRDWSLLGTLPELEYVDFYINHRIDRLWDMRGNTALSGLSIMNFTRLDHLDGISSAPNLKYFRIGDAARGRTILRSLLPLAGSSIEEVTFCGKDILDKDLSFLYGMKDLRVFDFPARLYSTEEVAFIAANFPRLTGYSIKPYIVLTEKLLGEEETSGHIVVGRRKPFLRFAGHEKRLQNYARAFETLKERYAGMDYHAAFPVGRKPRRLLRKRKAAKRAGRKTGKAKRTK